jgi:hypothetical protein
VLDTARRTLNARGVHLVDWDGFVANPAAVLTLRAPPDIAFPATAQVSANHPRLYFDLPSKVGAAGPTKAVTFPDAQTTVEIQVGVFPDRDGIDESYELSVTLDGADPRLEKLTITVHDQDRNQPLVSRILMDFTQDKTGFFADARAREVVQQAADDWSYFLDDQRFDAVPAKGESTFIWNADGFVSRTTTQNTAAFTGFLLYGYGIHSSAVRSGGEGSAQGKAQTSAGATLPLRRSGGLEVETQGNYNTLGWINDLEPDTWWRSANLGQEQNDLYSIVHHEMGHAHGFNRAYPSFLAAKASGLSSAPIAAYKGGPVAIDPADHFDKTIDPLSGFGAFGNEYNGRMPARRWIITRLDLLALEAIGYKLRPIAFAPWEDKTPDCTP